MSNYSIGGSQKQHISRLISIGLVIVMAFMCCFHIEIQPFFCISVILVYLLHLPKKILNPKNIVFFFYFVWYVAAPVFSSDFRRNRINYGSNVNKAFFMCFMIYVTSIIVIDIATGKAERRDVSYELDRKQRKSGKLITIGLFILGFIMYFLKTGGASAWLNDASNTYFSRRGLGQFYLLYTLTLMIIVFFLGQRIYYIKNEVNKISSLIFLLIFLVLNVPFVGSRGQMLMLGIMAFSGYLFNSYLISRNTIIIGICGCLTFLFTLAARLQDWKLTFSYLFNYFNTFDLFCKTLNDYKPEWFKTVFMPLTWPFIKVGLLSQEKFYDMNVWLTTKYFPGSWETYFSTQQWNIETDLYLSFHFYWGIPIVIFYFMLIAFLYKKAYSKGGIWKLIYINEAINIMSHLRGGVLIYWYWYLIPLYVWLVMQYDDSTKIRLKKKNKRVLWKKQ